MVDQEYPLPWSVTLVQESGRGYEIIDANGNQVFGTNWYTPDIPQEICNAVNKIPHPYVPKASDQLLQRVQRIIDHWSSQTGSQMQPFQQRVVEEKAHLDDKIEKLGRFIEDHSTVYARLPHDEKERLIRQRIAMINYSTILGERIEAFTNV